VPGGKWPLVACILIAAAIFAIEITALVRS
jgi:hypothetical protein